MNEVNYVIFRCSSSKKKIWCLYFLKVLQRDDEWNSKRRKDTKRESPKRYLSVKYIILKINYKKYAWITSLFVQKSLEAYRNSGIRPN